MKKEAPSHDDPARLLAHWREGVKEFNSGRLWHAHEAWERGWKGMSDPMRTWVQACIQVAGAHHLLGLGRAEPARALLASAARKFGAAKEAGQAVPRIEIEGWSEASPGRARIVV
jgi:hypothetical protein